MRPSEFFTQKLRRDDLTIFGDYNLDELDCVEDHIPHSSPISERVLLIQSDAHGCVQVVEVMDDYDLDRGATFVYVPLSFGPLRQPVHAKPTGYERACDVCRVFIDVDQLERAREFPLSMVCAPCSAELREDDEDPRDTELDHCDLCRGANCRACVGGP